MIQNQEVEQNTIQQLEGVVGTLLEEQENLKHKLIEQEKRLKGLTTQTPDKLTHSQSKANSNKKSLQESRKQIFQKKMHVKNHNSPHHISSSKIKIKSKSIPRENVDSGETMPKAKQMFAGKRGSVAEPTLRDSQHFLEKAEQQVNNNHNMVSKSVGHKALMDKIQGNFEPSNLKLASQNMKKVLRNNFKETFGKQSVKRSPRNIQQLEHEHFQQQYCTLDQRQEPYCLQDSLQKAEMSFDSRKKMYSSVQSVNLPQINMKRVVEQPQLRKSASHASNMNGKVTYEN